MLICRALEYLVYLSIFICMFRLTWAASLTPAGDTADSAPHSDKRDNLKRAMAECDNDFSWMCLKLEFVKLMERLGEQQELPLLNGITVVRNANATEAKTAEIMADVARSYPNDPSSRLNGYLLAKLSSFLQTRHLRLSLIDPSAVLEARSFGETGRKSKFGKKGGMEMIMAAGLMMKGTLMALGMGAIALMAGKALMTGLMALTLSGVLGLKSLAGGGGGKSTTYEIVAKPIYTSSHSHSVSHDEGHGHSGHSGSGYAGYARAFSMPAQQKVR